MKKVDKSVFCHISEFGFGGIQFYVTSDSPSFKNYQELNYPVGMIRNSHDYMVSSYRNTIYITAQNKSAISEGMVVEQITDIIDTLPMIGLSFKLSDMPGKWRKWSVQEIKDKINKLLKEG